MLPRVGEGMRTRALAVRVRALTGVRLYDCILAVEQTPEGLPDEERIRQAVDYLRRTMRLT